jgi:hypothetical protein
MDIEKIHNPEDSIKKVTLLSTVILKYHNRRGAGTQSTAEEFLVMPEA